MDISPGLGETERKYIVDMTADFPVFMTRYEAIENASLALWINHYLVRTFP